jgi:hypothetical protein
MIKLIILTNPRNSTLVFSDRVTHIHNGSSFSAQEPVLSNDLPLEIRILKSLHVFKSQLKTFYFRIAFNDLFNLKN